MIYNNLKKFFKTEPYFIDKESQIFRYIINFKSGFIFDLYNSYYEDFATITLKDIKTNFFIEIGIENTENIESLNEKLDIHFLKMGKIEVLKNEIISIKLDIPKKNSKLSPFLFDSTDFLELFCEFPKIIDQEKQIMEYSSIEINGYKVILYLSAFENSAILSLLHMASKKNIFSANLYDIEKIEAVFEKNKEQLHIYNIDNEPFIIQFKPFIFIDMNLGSINK